MHTHTDTHTHVHGIYIQAKDVSVIASVVLKIGAGCKNSFSANFLCIQKLIRHYSYSRIHNPGSFIYTLYIEGTIF